MSDVPERIWANNARPSGYNDFLSSTIKWSGWTEYVRADLVPQWQPIETAPKDGMTILAVRNEARHRSYTIIFWDVEDEEWAGYTAEDVKRLVKFQPTHWMPLPAPPAVASNG